MASRYFNQFVHSLNNDVTYLEGCFKVGAAGAVVQNSVNGSGITASSTLTIQRKSTGTYLLQLADPFNRLLGATFTIGAPVSTTQQLDGSSTIIVGKSYQISASTATPQSPNSLGSTGTNWYTLGLPANMTPYVGTPFVATSGASQLVGSSAAAPGTGWVQQITVGNIDHIEMLPNWNPSLFPTSAQTFDNGPGQTTSTNGGDLWFQTCKSSSGAPVETTAGTIIRYNLMLRNSSRTGFNEASTANLN